MSDTYIVTFDWIDGDGENRAREITVEADDPDEAHDIAWDDERAPPHGTASVTEQ